MKRNNVLLCALIALTLVGLLSGIVYAGFSFGLPGVVKERVEGLDRKVEEKEQEQETGVNNPPDTPGSLSPQDKAGDQPVDVDLSWSGGDPDAGDQVTYNLYFGTINPPTTLVSNDQSATTYDPGPLSYDTPYYWQIVATDNHDSSTTGPVWSFRTASAPPANNPPDTPSNPSPANGATNQNINVDLSWTGGDPDAGDIVTYDVYFGTAASPPKVKDDQSATTYDPGTLNYGDTYYWQIVATDNHDSSTTGPVWSFSTASAPPANNPPNTPGSPSPQDKAGDQPIDVDLRWTGGDPDAGDIVTYDVYFGTVNPPTTLVSNDQPDTNYDPGPLSYDTPYYWQIVATDNHDSSTTGPVWSFRTASAPPANNPPDTPASLSPQDEAGDQPVNVDLSWSGGDPDAGDQVTYNVYFSTDNPPATMVSSGQSGTTYDPGPLSYGDTYYWQIVATDNHDSSTTGPVWSFRTATPIDTWKLTSISVDGQSCNCPCKIDSYSCSNNDTVTLKSDGTFVFVGYRVPYYYRLEGEWTLIGDTFTMIITEAGYSIKGPVTESDMETLDPPEVLTGTIQISGSSLTFTFIDGEETYILTFQRI